MSDSGRGRGPGYDPRASRNALFTLDQGNANRTAELQHWFDSPSVNENRLVFALVGDFVHLRVVHGTGRVMTETLSVQVRPGRVFELTPEEDALLSRPTSKTGQLQRAAFAILLEHADDRQLPTSGRFTIYEAYGFKVLAKKDPRAKGRKPHQDWADALLASPHGRARPVGLDRGRDSHAAGPAVRRHGARIPRGRDPYRVDRCMER